jgi:hypothetical protein
LNIYTINTLSVLGEKDETYGYTYFGHVHESDFPVRFSSHQVIDDLKDKGRKIVAESQELRKSKKGDEYLQLKKVKLDADSQPSLKEQWDETVDKAPVNTPTPAPQAPKSTPPFTPTAKASTHTSNAYLKDVSNIPQFVWSKLLDHWDVRGMATNAAEASAFYEAVQFHSDELLKMIDHVRGVDESN